MLVSEPRHDHVGGNVPHTPRRVPQPSSRSPGSAESAWIHSNSGTWSPPPFPRPDPPSGMSCQPVGLESHSMCLCAGVISVGRRDCRCAAPVARGSTRKQRPIDQSTIGWWGPNCRPEDESRQCRPSRHGDNDEICTSCLQDCTLRLSSRSSACH